MNAASSGVDVASERAANFALSRNRNPFAGGRIGGTGAPGGGFAISVLHGLALVGRERRDVDEPDHLGSLPASVITAPP